MGWLSNARRHEQLLSPAAPAAKTASRVSAAGLRSYDDDDGDHLERRAARPIERAARLLRALGFRQEAHFVENIFFKGAWGSELLFALLSREWTARRAQ